MTIAAVRSDADSMSSMADSSSSVSTNQPRVFHSLGSLMSGDHGHIRGPRQMRISNRIARLGLSSGDGREGLARGQRPTRQSGKIKLRAHGRDPLSVHLCGCQHRHRIFFHCSRPAGGRRKRR
jgi:hypothetical protein